ncbi:MAG: hypothetical protein ACXV7E_05665 [Methylobacter sp.]
MGNHSRQVCLNDEVLHADSFRLGGNGHNDGRHPRQVAEQLQYGFRRIVHWHRQLKHIFFGMPKIPITPKTQRASS